MSHIKGIVFSIIFFIIGSMPYQAYGQRNEIYNERIRTVQTVVNGNWQAMPIMTLGGNNSLTISFDDLTHNYHRYIYKVEHCEADWSPSTSLFESAYLEGINGATLEDYVKESLNTTVLYNHYSITIPNRECSLKMSGNYRLTVYDDDIDEKVLSVCFMVVEPIMGVSLRVSTNTDIDVNRSHQQVDMTVAYSKDNRGKLIVSDPLSQIYTVVMQNGRWDNAVVNTRPNYIQSDRLVWTHNRDLIFDAGNEYLKFEMFDVHATTMGVDYTRFISDYYHCFLTPIGMRNNYVYDETPKGAYYIRNWDNYDSDYLCDYEWVHYKVMSPEVRNNVYLNGNWTNNTFSEEYRMHYNAKEGCYEAAILQKQGYYSYCLLMDDNGRGVPLPSQGNFYETRNDYAALVYYKAPSDRSWRLVGYSSVKIK